MFDNVFTNKKLFIGFVTGGDGGIDYCVECCLAMVKGGVDVLEIGYPFSDPIADGPIIQQSSQRALKQKTNSNTLLEIAKNIRKYSNVPLILFSYLNPLLKLDQTFLSEAKKEGYDGILVVDLPISDNNFYFELIKAAGLCPIVVAAPSSDLKRLNKIVGHAHGFIYYVCQKGTTGFKKNLPDYFPIQINQLKKLTHLPIVSGFGITNKKMGKSVLQHADGFVVGSAFVDLMAKRKNPSELKKLAQLIDPRT